MRRPFARTFDLISSEYGWTDDQILDLTMARMRQVREVILERQQEDWRRHVRLEEAKLRTLAGSVHAAAGNKAGAQAASKIRLIKDDKGERPGRGEIPSLSQVHAAFGGTGVDPAYGLYTEDEIAAEAEKIREARRRG